MAEAVFLEEFSGDQVVLSTAASVILTASPRASASEPESFILQNNESIDITVGGSTVTDGANGVLLVGAGNRSVTVTCRSPLAQIQAIAASGTPSLNVTRA